MSQAPDSSDIEAAVIATLLADAGPGGLRTLLPDGVFMDEAGASMVDGAAATRFVIVSLIDEHDETAFGGTAFEDALYLVEARALSKINGAQLPPLTIKAAAARIQALLHEQPLAIPGYRLMLMARESRVRRTEIDDADPSIRWFRRGGRYRIIASPQ